MSRPTSLFHSYKSLRVSGFSMALLRFLLLSLLTLSLQGNLSARDIDEASLEKYQIRKDEYETFYSRDDVKNYFDSLKNQKCEFPYCFESMLLKKPDDKKLMRAVELASAVMNDWIGVMKEQKLNLQCSRVDIILENHMCPNCYVEKELRVNEALQGGVVLVAEGNSSNLSLLSHYEGGLFPLLGKYTREEASTVIHGVENASFLYFMKAVELGAGLEDLFQTSPEVRERFIDFDDFFKKESNHFIDLTASILGDALGISVGAFSPNFEMGEALLDVLPVDNPRLIKFINFIKVQMRGRDLSKSEDYQWVKSDLVPKLSHQVTYEDLKTLVTLAKKAYVDKKLVSTLKEAGISHALAFKIKDFVESDLETSNGELSMELYTLALRNLSFSDKILALCQNETNKDKVVSVQVGQAHGAGLAHLLKEVPGLTIEIQDDTRRFELLGPEGRAMHFEEKLSQLKKMPTVHQD